MERHRYDFVSPTARPNRRSNSHSKRLASLCKETVSEEPLKFQPNRLSLFNHVFKRELHGKNEKPIKSIVSKHLSAAMPTLLREHELDLGEVNKVFAAQWISDSLVVMGSKCNKILIKDVYTNETILIPTIDSTGRTEAPDCSCGIHAISLNPSKTLLATGAEHTNDLGVYRLPSFDPVYLGERGHSDWIFDLTWVDDEYCVTGSRDSKLALWKIVDEGEDEQGMDIDTDDSLYSSLRLPSHQIREPEAVKRIPQADKIRALAYNSNSMELGVLSMDSRIHTIDVCNFQTTASEQLQYSRETVCLAYDYSKQVYAVGSQSHVTLMDRDLKPVLNIEALKKGCGIRSLSFNENIVTIGTGVGSVLFYDMNAGKYLHCTCGHICELNTGDGYLLLDSWRDNLSASERHNAIYTHCYDDTGSRLFTAGGPLPANLIGNYAGIWQ
ncbi:DDB1- and CUL4-associated factor 12-B-like [Watersipora subatra]|uniref:DDB1- and CUL4-associated factor 12-B-like n=1 Tax=Watersipora subatra TaxID=2589382 RepID=UPI00355B160A